MKRRDIVYDGLHSYKLTRDVQNPNGDKRQKNDWRKISLWTKGMTFLAIMEENWIPGIKDEDPDRKRDRPMIQQSHVQFPSIYRTAPDNLPDDFFEALEPDKLSLRERLEGKGWEHWHSPVLDSLVAMGKITVEDIYSAVEHAQNQPD